VHRGPYVYVTKGSRTYHYTDDDCPVTSSILKGKKPFQRITEEQAQQMGLKLCRHCAKEYREDQVERQANRFSVYLGAVIAVVMVIAFFLLTD